MPRIHGVETEYGLRARSVAVGVRGRLSPPEAAQLLFAPVEHDNASSNVFLRNGGRLYLDVGSHPEYATAECRGVGDLLVQERAGDQIMDRLAARAEVWAAERGRSVELRLFKNNVDSHHNSYGSHENYSLDRSLDLAEVARLLTPFLVTRQLLCGSGRWTPEGFLISQRADHVHDGLSPMTTRARPLINTRDEPLADPARFRRLHVLAGDSNLSEPSAALKIGSLGLVLDALEAGRLPDLTLADPGRCVRDVARDPAAPLTLADGTTTSAVAVQRRYLEAVAVVPAITDAWAAVLDALAAGRPEVLEADVEWVAKRRLLERFAARHHLSWGDRRLAQVDLAFHDITTDADGRPRGLFRLLERSGAVRRLTDPAAVDAAVSRPPADTRAVLRGRLIAAAQRHGRSFTVDWLDFAAHDVVTGPGATAEVAVRLPDPFATADPAAEALIGALERGWQPPG